VRRAIGKYSRDFIAIVFLVVLAAGVAGYVLSHERLRFPWEPAPFKLKAEFSTAQAVTPGQGQTVRVSGVQVGDIGAVSLHNGVATVTMDLDPKYAPNGSTPLVHKDASALLRPKTGLKDMFIELTPGTSKAALMKQGDTIPVANTLPDVNPDQIFAALDSDTRDYLRLLVEGAGQGLKGRGNDLQEVFARFEPTHRDIARITALLAKRHADLASLIHSLDVINLALQQRGPQLTALVHNSSQVFNAFASEQANLSRAVANLPGALKTGTSTFGKLQTLAEVLRPTADKIRPAIQSLSTANGALTPFFRQTTPIVAQKIRPFVRDARPLVPQLTAPAQSLASASPDLTKTFNVFNHLFNLAAYNTHGNGPYNGSGDASYLFWLAWLAHDGVALFSSADSISTYRPTTDRASCHTLRALVAGQPQLEFLQGLTAILTNPTFCGAAP
jgi:phospholipid/cholesterol/gamma-HCH transport system substrate-binding protein